MLGYQNVLKICIKTILMMELELLTHYFSQLSQIYNGKSFCLKSSIWQHFVLDKQYYKVLFQLATSLNISNCFNQQQPATWPSQTAGKRFTTTTYPGHCFRAISRQKNSSTKQDQNLCDNCCTTVSNFFNMCLLKAVNN